MQILLAHLMQRVVSSVQFVQQTRKYQKVKLNNRKKRIKKRRKKAAKLFECMVKDETKETVHASN